MGDHKHVFAVWDEDKRIYKCVKCDTFQTERQLEMKRMARTCELEAQVERLRKEYDVNVGNLLEDNENLRTKVERLENRWISVDQRLPDTQKMVLCYMPVAYNGQIHYGWLNQDLDFRGNPSKKTWREHSHNAYAHAMEDPLFTGTDASKVTHWMPLPEPPAKEKGE